MIFGVHRSLGLCNLVQPGLLLLNLCFDLISALRFENFALKLPKRLLEVRPAWVRIASFLAVMDLSVERVDVAANFRSLLVDLVKQVSTCVAYLFPVGFVELSVQIVGVVDFVFLLYRLHCLFNIEHGLAHCVLPALLKEHLWVSFDILFSLCFLLQSGYDALGYASLHLGMPFIHLLLQLCHEVCLPLVDGCRCRLICHAGLQLSWCHAVLRVEPCLRGCAKMEQR